MTKWLEKYETEFTYLCELQGNLHAAQCPLDEDEQPDPKKIQEHKEKLDLYFASLGEDFKQEYGEGLFGEAYTQWRKSNAS